MKNFHPSLFFNGKNHLFYYILVLVKILKKEELNEKQ